MNKDYNSAPVERSVRLFGDIEMQETRYFDEEGHEQRLVELFVEPNSENSTEKLFAKMNNRLFKLEQRGHELVQQKQITLSEKLAIERAKKAKKKLNRMKKASA